LCDHIASQSDGPVLSAHSSPYSLTAKKNVHPDLFHWLPQATNIRAEGHKVSRDDRANLTSGGSFRGSTLWFTGASCNTPFFRLQRV
jgi:hypothetical protein